MPHVRHDFLVACSLGAEKLFSVLQEYAKLVCGMCTHKMEAYEFFNAQTRRELWLKTVGLKRRT